MEDEIIKVLLVDGAWWSDVANLLSIVAIAISIISAHFAHKQYQLEKKNIVSGYFLELTKGVLSKDFPQARRSLTFTTNNTLSEGYEELTNVIGILLKNIGFFRFQDKKLYDKLNNELTELDELIVEMADRQAVSSIRQREFLNDVDKRISNIYDALLTKHTGK